MEYLPNRVPLSFFLSLLKYIPATYHIHGFVVLVLFWTTRSTNPMYTWYVYLLTRQQQHIAPYWVAFLFYSTCASGFKAPRLAGVSLTVTYASVFRLDFFFFKISPFAMMVVCVCWKEEMSDGYLSASRSFAVARPPALASLRPSLCPFVGRVETCCLDFTACLVASLARHLGPTSLPLPVRRLFLSAVSWGHHTTPSVFFFCLLFCFFAFAALCFVFVGVHADVAAPLSGPPSASSSSPKSLIHVIIPVSRPPPQYDYGHA